MLSRWSRPATIQQAPLRDLHRARATEEGLDQEFNSLDAQRDACEAYVASQTSRGLGAGRRTITTTAGSRAARWSAQRCAGCWPISSRGRST